MRSLGRVARYPWSEVFGAKRMRAVLIGLGLAALTAGVGPAASGPLDAYRWRSRVLVLSASGQGDERLKAQRADLASVPGGIRARDLVVLEAVGDGPEAAALRHRLGLPADAFRAVLVGKDGGAKLASDAPIPAERLFTTIDAMPMRRNEMRR